MPEPQRKRPYRETLEALVIAAIFLRFANTFVVQTFYIPSGSMEETLLVGDHLFVNRFIYGPTATGLERKLLPHREVERGDVVIFRSPEDPRTDLVKRCLGQPGDRVDLADKRLYLNGVPVADEAFVQHTDPTTYADVASLGEQARRRDQFGPETVPEGHYFCLGDNRDESYDSRFLGPIPGELIKGRASLIYWSNQGETPDGRRETWGRRLARIVKTLVLFPVNTRWERTFQLIR
ncbi:MAG TPA: signal peptidase I [Thermoanaerobaculia bacterium]|nr:signal peptidase I [Thermoanaerobaculia bacterium]